MENLSEKAKTYRIIIEAIGPEETVLNSGVPLIIETDGFFIIGCSKQDNGEEVEREMAIVAHHISPGDIGKGLVESDREKEIVMAMMIERMKKAVADDEEG